MTNQEFNTLPASVQSEAKNILKAFNTVYIELNGDSQEYEVSAHVCLHNGKYNKFIGQYNSIDVFTIEDRILNYVREFREFPYHCSNGAHYEGKKDWKALNSNWVDVKLVNGDLEFIY